MFNRRGKNNTENKCIRYWFLLLFTGIIAAVPASGSSMPLMGMFGGHGSHGYVGSAFKLNAVRSEPGVWAGLRGGWIFEQAFSMGFGGYWLLTEVKQTNFNNANMGYGGIEFQAFLSADTPVQFAIKTLIGVGSVGDGFHFMGHSFNRHHADEEMDSFVVVEPGVTMLMRFNPYVRLGIGASYLVSSGLEFQEISGRALGGLTGTLTLTFGGWRSLDRRRMRRG